MEKRVSIYKKENLRALRRYLGLTQKQFIQKYLSTEENSLGISIATYSNYESKDSNKLSHIILKISDMMNIDPLQFTLEEERFMEQLPSMFLYNSPTSKVDVTENKNVSHLLHVLTIYFSGKLLTGELNKGDKIESNDELAKKVGATKSSIKEALKILDVLGVIDIQPGKGVFLNSKEAKFLTNPLTWSLFLRETSIENMLEIRDIIQIRAIEVATKNQSVEFRNELHDIHHKLHLAYINSNQTAFIEGDALFHLCIVKGSENPVFYNISETVNSLIKQISQERVYDLEHLKAIHDEHNCIFGFILAGDAQNARDAMEAHVKNSYNRYQG